MVLKFSHFGSIFLLIGLLTFSRPAATFAITVPETTNTQRSGAASLDELSAVLFSAVKSNNFGQLSSFFPGQEELRLLQKGSSKTMQLIAEEVTPEQIQGSFKTDFEALMKASVERMLNWSELNLAETSPTRFQGPRKVLAPVKVYLSAGENQAQHYLLYEAVKIRNRYYLFQHLTLQKST